MAYYGIPFNEMMAMPLKRFWLMSECIDRIQSSFDLRLMRVGSAVQSQEGFTESVESLKESVGTVILKDYEMDLEGLSRLKRLM